MRGVEEWRKGSRLKAVGRGSTHSHVPALYVVVDTDSFCKGHVEIPHVVGPAHLTSAICSRLQREREEDNERVKRMERERGGGGRGRKAERVM